jgi:hypothetical protein
VFAVGINRGSFLSLDGPDVKIKQDFSLDIRENTSVANGLKLK